MSTFVEFLFEFISVFIDGLLMIIKGIFKGFVQMFNFPEYLRVFNYYKGELSIGGMVLAIVTALIIIILLALIILLFVFLARKYIRFRKTLVEQESMLNEIANLNNQVNTLVKEKEKLLAMKVSRLGLKPGQGSSMIEDVNTEAEEPVMETSEEGETKPEMDLKNMDMDKVYAALSPAAI